MTSSLPASLRLALVHLTFLGLRFILKFLWHFDLQNLNICTNCIGETCSHLRMRQQGAPKTGTHCSIISDKLDAMAWIDSAGAEPALLQAHFAVSAVVTRPRLKCQKWYQAKRCCAQFVRHTLLTAAASEARPELFRPRLLASEASTTSAWRLRQLQSGRTVSFGSLRQWDSASQCEAELADV